MLPAVLLDGTQALASYLWTVLRLEDEALEVLGFLRAAGQHSVATVLAVSATGIILAPCHMVPFGRIGYLCLSVLFEFGSDGHYAFARIY